MTYFTTYMSPVGELLLACDGKSLTGLWLKGQRYYPTPETLDVMEERDVPVLNRTRQWLDRYFAGERPDPCALPLAPRGTAFRKAVWELLLAIPYGETLTYRRLAEKTARKLGRKSMSFQAVGGAVGHNPISIIIPCHRVIGSDGNLTGYAGGLDRKQWLLAHEGFLPG